MRVNESAPRYVPESERAHYLTLKEAAERTGYTPDYIGQLIRSGKIEGFQVYTNVSWVTTAEALHAYTALRGKTEVGEQEDLAILGLRAETVKVCLWGFIAALTLLFCLLLYVTIVRIDRGISQSSMQEFDLTRYDTTYEGE